MQFGKVRVRVYRHVIGTDEPFVKENTAKVNQTRKALEKALKDYEPLAYDADDRRLLEEDRTILAEWFRNRARIREFSEANRKDEAQGLWLKHSEVAIKRNDHFVEHIKYDSDPAKKSAAEGAAMANPSPVTTKLGHCSRLSTRCAAIWRRPSVASH